MGWWDRKRVEIESTKSHVVSKGNPITQCNVTVGNVDIWKVQSMYQCIVKVYEAEFIQEILTHGYLKLFKG